MKFKVGDKVIFTAYNDLAWGKQYAGQVAVVTDVEDDGNQDDYGLDVEFKDGQSLGVMSNECIHDKTRGRA